MSGGLTVPTWTEGGYPEEKLREAAIMESIFSSWNVELKRYTGGSYITDVGQSFLSEIIFLDKFAKKSSDLLNILH